MTILYALLVLCVTVLVTIITLCMTLLYSFSLHYPDINECQINASLCRSTGDCVNVPGTYNCSCHSGYELPTTGLQQCLGKNTYNSSLSWVNVNINYTH